MSPDEIIERCITAMQTQGYTVEDCLALYPAERIELEPTLRLVMRLNMARSLQPAPAFIAAAPSRLKNLAAARQKTHRRADRTPNFLPLQIHLTQRSFSLLLAGLLIAALITFSFGTASASASALPGDFLYPLKRARENLRLSLTADEVRRANLHLDYANQRLDEALNLANQNRTSSIDQTVTDYREQIQAELAFLEQDGRLSADEQAVLAEKLLAQAARQDAGLTALSSLVPSSQAKIASARSASANVFRQAEQIKKSHGGGKQPVPTLPTGTSRPAQPLKTTSTPTLPLVAPSTATGAPPTSVPGHPLLTPTPALPANTPTRRPSPAPGSVLRSPTPTHMPLPSQGASPTPSPKPATIVRTKPPTLTPNTGSIATRRATQTALPSPNPNVGPTSSTPVNASPTSTLSGPASNLLRFPTPTR